MIRVANVGSMLGRSLFVLKRRLGPPISPNIKHGKLKSTCDGLCFVVGPRCLTSRPSQIPGFHSWCGRCMTHARTASFRYGLAIRASTSSSSRNGIALLSTRLRKIRKHMKNCNRAQSTPRSIHRFHYWRGRCGTDAGTDFFYF
jgi:hypothetical protein